MSFDRTRNRIFFQILKVFDTGNTIQSFVLKIDKNYKKTGKNKVKYQTEIEDIYYLENVCNRFIQYYLIADFNLLCMTCPNNSLS